MFNELEYKYAIIIPIYNRIEITKRGLNYIQESINYYNTITKNNDVVLVIVDDGSKDNSVEWIEDNIKDVHIIKSQGGLWWTGSINLGIKYVINQFKCIKGIILQNDDIIIQKDWLFALLYDASRNDKALIGCATVDAKNPNIINFGGIKRNAWIAISKYLNKGKVITEYSKGYVCETDVLYGRGLYIPISVIESLGLFNERKYKHRGDAEIPLLARKRGYKLLVSYTAVVEQLTEQTYIIDQCEKLNLRDFKKVFFDFRSSSYYKYIFYYSEASTENIFQFIIFFISYAFIHLKSFSSKVIRNIFDRYI